MISTETLKQYLNIDGTGKDSFLGACITRAVSEVETICNRKFESGNYTDIVNGNTKLYLQNYPVNSITKIEVKNFNNWETVSDSTCYIDLNVNAVFVENVSIPKGKNNVKVTYNSGWGLDECNKDIENVILEMASIFYYNSPVSGEARLGKTSKSLNSNTSEWIQYRDLNPEWQKKLSKYRIRKTG